MGSSPNAPRGFKERPVSFEGFMGIDDSRDPTAMETGKDQHLVTLNNGYCDWRGQIMKDPAIRKRGGDFPVVHCRWFSPNNLCWAEQRGGGIWFNSDFNHVAEPNWNNGAIPSSVVFNRKAFFFSSGLQPWTYDGTNWSPSESNTLTLIRPSFAAAVQRRLCVAGATGRETIVDISRVDNDEIFVGDEDDTSNNVLRAGFIDVGNLLGTADQITGLGTFEQTRLAIFTQDRCLIYKIDPDILQWEIEDRANIQIGCISHNSIAQAGTDVLFCSRSGVHSLRRSVDNGITVYSQPMSDKVEFLYRRLLAQVANQQDITGVWDRDNSQYRIFFPLVSGETVSLVMTLNTSEEAIATGAGVAIPKWSTSTGFNVMTGAALGGLIALGTKGGAYDVLENEDGNGDQPVMTFTTPVLWNGDFDGTKECSSLLIQASGKGTIEIDAFDEKGKDLGAMTVEVDEQDDDDSFPDIALRRQYTVKFERRYRGLQLRFTAKAKGLFRISGFAVILRK